MTDISKKVADFVELNPRKFPVLRMVTITQGDGIDGVYEQRVSVILARDVDDESELLHVEFYGVRQLVFSQPDFSVINIHLEILDASMVQGTVCTFFVRDTEQEKVICFECSDFEAYKT